MMEGENSIKRHVMEESQVNLLKGKEKNDNQAFKSRIVSNISGKMPNLGQDFVLDPDSFEMMKYEFATDPVSILKKLLVNLGQDSDGSSMIENSVWMALGEIDHLLDAVHESGIEIIDDTLSVYDEQSMATDEGVSALFVMLRDAGYEKKDISDFINMSMPDNTDQKLFEVRRQLGILDRIYGENK